MNGISNLISCYNLTRPSTNSSLIGQTRQSRSTLTKKNIAIFSLLTIVTPFFSLSFLSSTPSLISCRNLAMSFNNLSHLSFDWLHCRSLSASSSLDTCIRETSPYQWFNQEGVNQKATAQRLMEVLQSPGWIGLKEYYEIVGESRPLSAFFPTHADFFTETHFYS